LGKTALESAVFIPPLRLIRLFFQSYPDSVKTCCKTQLGSANPSNIALLAHTQVLDFSLSFSSTPLGSTSEPFQAPNIIMTSQKGRAALDLSDLVWQQLSLITS
jgi:hypothetical protein